MRKILTVLVAACFLTGCVGLGQGIGGDKMKVTTDFENIQAGVLDAEGNPTEGESIKYRQTVIGQPGDVISAVAKMAIRVQNADNEYWTIDLAQDNVMDSTAQAEMLAVLGVAELETVGVVTNAVVKAAIEAVLPGYLAQTEAGVAKKAIDADTIRLIAVEVSKLLQGGAVPNE